MDIPLRCTCGAVRGVAHDASPAHGNRVVCHCDDCQAFACFLDREDLLDRFGGSDLYHLTPSQISIHEGRAELRCLRLSPKGLMRWYTHCCSSPISSTMPSPKAPFVSLACSFMDEGARERALGEPIAYVNARYAIRGRPAGAHDTAPLSFVAKSLPLFLGAYLRGKHAPSPFFDARDGKPASTPRVLDLETRTKLRERVASLATRA